MATAYCGHRIEVTNLTEGEAVEHSILLIKGIVSLNCQSAHVVSVNTESRKRVTEPIVTSISHNGKFKALLNLKAHQDDYGEDDLASGINLSLRIKYCHSNCMSVIDFVHKVPKREFAVQPLYIICSGNNDKCNSQLENALEIIDLNVELVQAVFAEKIREAGFGRKTFFLNGNCQVFRSQLTREAAWKSTEHELWEYFGKEILNSSLGRSTHLKFVAFIECTKYDGSAVVAENDYSYANIKRHLKAHAALGGGGLALFGSRYFYAWPQHFENIIKCISNQTPIDIALHPDDSNYRRTYGGVYATTLGAVCHELGHTFDLGHTNDGVMGSGLDYFNRIFTVDNLTENLPDRIVEDVPIDCTRLPVGHRAKLTKFKKNNFLDRYHNQKDSEPFYFTRNCAIILANHFWLTDHSSSENSPSANQSQNITYDSSKRMIVSRPEPLKLIEVRQISNSLVKHFFEFEESVFEFQLHCGKTFNEQMHYLFVLTTGGHIKQLYVKKNTDPI